MIKKFREKYKKKSLNIIKKKITYDFFLVVWNINKLMIFFIIN
jgi:hypothetical protein